jgi:sugar lactone lactonase YvrE
MKRLGGAVTTYRLGPDRSGSSERGKILIQKRPGIDIGSAYLNGHLSRLSLAFIVVLGSMFVSASASAADCTSPITSFRAGSIGIQQISVIASDPTGSGNLTNSCDPYDEGIYATQVEASNGDDGVAFPIPLDQVSGTLYGTYSVYLSPSQESIYYTPSTNPGTAYSNVLTIWTYDSNLNIVSETITVNIPATSVPGAPTIGTASAGNAQATVNFTAPVSGGDNPITSYTVTSSPGGIIATGSNAPIIVTGLSNGTTYTFTVTATSSSGTGPASQPSNAVTPLSVPGAPMNIVATPGNSEAVVSFAAPTSNGGAAITSYTATSSPGSYSATGNASPLTVTGLADGTSYTFTVTAANRLGSSALSVPSNPVTPTAAPIAEAVSVTIAYDSGIQPIQLNLAGGSSTSVMVASPASHGSAQASGTVITYSPSTGYFGSDAFTYIAANSAGVSSAATVSIIVNGPTITVSPTSLVSGVEGAFYNQSLVAVGGQAPYRFSPNVASGALPAGLSISSSGAISGTPTVTCTCTFTVAGVDSSTATPQSFVSTPISLSVVEMAATVSGISPSSDVASGGATINITGANFTSGSIVKFGSTPATQVTYLNSDNLIAVAPAGTGTVDVTVTTAGGTSMVSAADQFTYLAQVGQLSNPLGVAVDGSGSIYIADADLTYIIKVPPGCSTQSCETIVGGGFTAPTGIAIDGNGTLYVLSGGSGGTVTKLAWNAATSSYGQQSVVTSGLNLSATAPSGIAVDSTGNLYITDTNNQRVVELPWIANAAAYGSLITIEQESGLSKPDGVAVDPDGVVYIADSGTQTLNRVNTAGSQTVLATSIAAAGVALDGNGDVYYSDSNANTITKIPWSGSAFGPPVTIASALAVPYGIVVDVSGNLYIASNKSATIAKVTVTSPPVFNFRSAKVDATSIDSPMIATLGNIGNALLTFVPVAGTNPQISSGFMLDSETTCPDEYPTSESQTLAQGASCQYAIAFVPTSVGALSGALVLADDNLNATAASQSIALSGIGTADDASLVVLNIAPASSVPYGNSVTITANVSDTTTPSNTPAGSVDFSITKNSASTEAINSNIPLTNGEATLSNYTPASAGTYTITGNYSGAVGSLSASAATASFTVIKYTPTLTYAPAITTQSYGAPVPAGALNATAIDATGAVIPGTFAYSTMVGSTSTQVDPGSTVLPASTYTFTATFTPTDTADYVSGGSIVATASYTVTRLSANVQLGDLSQVYSTAAHVPSVATTPSNLGINLTYNGSSIAPIDPGNYTVIATVTDPNYTGTATGILVIAKALPSSVVLVSSTNPVLVKSALVLTATVSTSVGTPTGAVSFLDGDTILGTGTLNNGVASLSTTDLSVGAHSLTAVYQGDSDFLTLTSQVLPQTVLNFVLTISTPTGAPPTTTTQPGGTATYQLDISPTGSDTFPAAVMFSVTGLPPGATYKLTPPDIPAGAGPTNVILTVILAQTSSSLSYKLLTTGPFTLALALLPFGVGMRRSGKNTRHGAKLLQLLIFLASIITGISGCAGNGGSSQQGGSYVLTLRATSSGLIYTSTVTLVVD